MSKRSWHNFNYITPEKAVELNIRDGDTLEDYQRRAKDNSECHCGEPVWHMVNELGMCFSCVTGETDASDDYELEAI